MTTPDPRIVEALGEHALVTGVRDMRKHCTCGWESGERVGPFAHRAHLATVLEPLIRERVAERLDEAATALVVATEGTHREGTARWPERNREIYSLAIEEAQGVLRARAAAIREGGE